MSAYLRVTILGQHLQHRRFSALNVSHKNQFTPHNQRLRVSSFLHDENVIDRYIYLFCYLQPFSFVVCLSRKW